MLGSFPPDSPIYEQHAEPHERENWCDNAGQVPRVKDLIKFAFSGRVPSVKNHWNGGNQQTDTPASAHQHQGHSSRYVSAKKKVTRKRLRPPQLPPKIGPKSIWPFRFDIFIYGIKWHLTKISR